MKTHTIEGQFMLDRVGGMLGEIGEIVRSCHERWDGTGYPDGLAGDAIPLPARIVFACDAYNAMTTDRVYRRALSMERRVTSYAINPGPSSTPGSSRPYLMSSRRASQWSRARTRSAPSSPTRHARARRRHHLVRVPRPVPVRVQVSSARLAAVITRRAAAPAPASAIATRTPATRSAHRRQRTPAESPRGERVLDAEDPARQSLRDLGLDQQPLVDEHHAVADSGRGERHASEAHRGTAARPAARRP